MEFERRHGTFNVPKMHVFECMLPGLGDDGSVYHYKGKLGQWLSTQRQVKRGGTKALSLDPNRERLLQRLVDEGERASDHCSIYRLIVT
jgi:hypothetical protein